MRRSTVALLLVLAAGPLAAQRATVGAEFALADYREQAAHLRFQGTGFTARLELSVWRLEGQVRTTRLTVDATETNGVATDAFVVEQPEFRIRYHVSPRFGIEAGAFNRSVDPEHAAQGMRAWRAGGVFVQPLAPGSDVGIRASYVRVTRFAGGGTAPFGVELGLGVSYGPGAGRFRLTGEYEFQRIDRRTTIGGQRLEVPIQSAVARVGLSAAFGR
ncbi:MAG: hypothetical protein ACT4PJ_16575 [Gemmatimonadaceae bacterium]